MAPTYRAPSFGLRRDSSGGVRAWDMACGTWLSGNARPRSEGSARQVKGVPVKISAALEFAMLLRAIIFRCANRSLRVELDRARNRAHQAEAAMNVVKPIVGQWYRGSTNELFEVVAIDDGDETIEVQYFDGTVTEIEFDCWNEQLLDELIDAADAPEDWSGAVDVEAEDLDREFEDNARTAWSNPQDRSLRR